MSIPAIAIRGGITLLSEVIQIVSGIVMLIPQREKREILPGRIYNTIDAAKLLGTTRQHVIQLIRDNELSAKRVGDRYHISGKNLMRFLTHEMATINNRYPT